MTGDLLRQLDLGRVNGASAVAFNPGNEFVVAVAVQDPQHSVLIFNWKISELYAKVEGGDPKVLCMAFSMYYPPALGATPPNPEEEGEGAPKPDTDEIKAVNRLFVGGVGNFRIVDRVFGTSFKSRVGLYGEGVKKSNVLCVAACPVSEAPEPGEPENEFVFGMSDGTIGTLAKGPSRKATFADVMKNEEDQLAGIITSVCVVKMKDAASADEVGIRLSLHISVVFSTDDIPPPPLFRSQVPEYKIVIGGTNGIVKVLSQALEPLREFNLYSAENCTLVPLGKVFTKANQTQPRIPRFHACLPSFFLAVSLCRCSSAASSRCALTAAATRFSTPRQDVKLAKLNWTPKRSRM